MNFRINHQHCHCQNLYNSKPSFLASGVMCHDINWHFLCCDFLTDSPQLMGTEFALRPANCGPRQVRPFWMEKTGTKKIKPHTTSPTETTPTPMQEDSTYKSKYIKSPYPLASSLLFVSHRLKLNIIYTFLYNLKFCDVNPTFVWM